MNQEAVVAGAVAGFQEEGVEEVVSRIGEMIGFPVEGEAEVVGEGANGEELQNCHGTLQAD